MTGRVFVPLYVSLSLSLSFFLSLSLSLSGLGRLKECVPVRQ